MEKAYKVYKMFHSPADSEYEGFFCIYETKDAFLGYNISKVKPERGIIIYLGKKNPANIRYIDCDQLYEFPKTLYYEKLMTRYKLKDLRDATELLISGKIYRCVIDGQRYEIKDYDTTTPEQRQNRNNRDYIQKLRRAHALLERAKIQNDKKTEEEQTKIIEELNDKLGYRETVRPGKYKLQLKDTVTNIKPFGGGSCTPK